MGPRGLTVLERLVANERVRRSGTLHIYISGHTQVAARNARNPTSTGTLVYEQRDC